MISKGKLKELANEAINDERIFLKLLEDTLSKKDEIRFKSNNILNFISEKYPNKLYKKWDFFSDMLDSKNHYQRNIAINILANISKIDTEKKFEKNFDKYFDNISSNRTMVAGQAAINSGKIAKAKPHLQSKITEILLNIDKIHKGKQTELMKAYAINAFNDYFDDYGDKEKILKFVKEQFNSDSPKTKKAASEFLNKWNK
jgi:hypothetical protein